MTKSSQVKFIVSLVNATIPENYAFEMPSTEWPHLTPPSPLKTSHSYYVLYYTVFTITICTIITIYTINTVLSILWYSLFIHTVIMIFYHFLYIRWSLFPSIFTLMGTINYAPQSLDQHRVLLEVLLGQFRYPRRTIGSLTFMIGPRSGPGRIPILWFLLSPLQPPDALDLSSGSCCFPQSCQ